MTQNTPNIRSRFPLLSFILLVSRGFLVLVQVVTCTKFRHTRGLLRLRGYFDVHDTETLDFLQVFILAHLLLAGLLGTAHNVGLYSSS